MKYIIVGGTSGIGLAAAKMAIDAGNEVIAVGRDPAKFPAAESIVSRVKWPLGVLAKPKISPVQSCF